MVAEESLWLSTFIKWPWLVYKTARVDADAPAALLEHLSLLTAFTQHLVLATSCSTVACSVECRVKILLFVCTHHAAVVLNCIVLKQAEC